MVRALAARPQDARQRRPSDLAIDTRTLRPAAVDHALHRPLCVARVATLESTHYQPDPPTARACGRSGDIRPAAA
jgi:hypothetical protein